MKTILNSLKTYLAATLLAGLLLSCDKGLVDLNQNPNAYTAIIPDYMFTKAQLDAVNNNYFGTAALTIGGSMQHFATYKEVPAAGDKYLNESYSYAYFGTAYTGAANEVQEVIRAVSAAPQNVNKLSAARIWRVYTYHRLTDVYGDVPYFDAAKGSTEKNYSPVYDKQELIYRDMLKELDEAANAFDPAKATFGPSDLLYNGNVVQWKKFAYSLMLRLGLRLSKVDATGAKSWVGKAIAGGVITQDADIARIQYVDGSQVASRNPIAQALLVGDYIDPQNIDNVEGGKYAKTFIDYLKTTGDPRLNVMAVVWVKSPTGAYAVDTTTATQIGMKNAAFNGRPADFATYSEPHPRTVLKYDAPLLVMTNAEVNLSLAEAAVRGWYAGETAAALYENGVRAGLRQWALFGTDGVISAARINGYVARNPFVATGTETDKLAQINTQKWVSLFLDEYEIFANWRRTGYPVLTPTNYPGNLTGGAIPRHFVLPPAEESINGINFREAVARQGSNTLLTRVWWDK